MNIDEAVILVHDMLDAFSKYEQASERRHNSDAGRAARARYIIARKHVLTAMMRPTATSQAAQSDASGDNPAG